VAASAWPGPAGERHVAATRPLTGQFLVATDELRDPRFIRTVIYLTRHDASGAMGFVVNRPMREVPLAQLLERFGLPHRDVTARVRVHYGGPVQAGRGFVLHTADFAGEGTEVIGGNVAVTTEPGILTAIAAGAGPRRALFVAGYAGWAPGQLEAEIDGGAWISVPADEALIFGDDHETKWERAMARRRLNI